MKQFPEVARFLSYFDGRARERRPILAIVGETGLGKSLLAGEVLKEVGRRLGKADFLEVTVEILAPSTSQTSTLARSRAFFWMGSATLSYSRTAISPLNGMNLHME